MKSLSLAIAAACLVGMASCNNAKKPDAAESRTSFFDRSGMDSTVKPGDNFFLYANGAWMKTSMIPDDQTGLGSFYTLYEDNLKKLKGILEDAEKAKRPKEAPSKNWVIITQVEWIP